MTCCSAWKKARIHNSNPTFSMLRRVNVGICLLAKVHVFVCVCFSVSQAAALHVLEYMKQWKSQLKYVWLLLWEPLFNFACLENVSKHIHITQLNKLAGSAGEESCCACAACKLLHSCSICMHTQTALLLACMRHVHLLAHTHAYICLFLCTNPFAPPPKACSYVGDHNLYCSARVNRTLNLN